MQDLGGVWTLSDESGQYRVAMRLPGDGISALHQAGVIPDPYHGRNEYGLRWICERDWTISRSFTHDGSPAELCLEGLDTLATVTLNGAEVLRAANAHRRWRVEVSGALKAGRNEIALTFHAAPQAAAATQAGLPFPVPYHQPNCPIPNGNMLRKPQ